MENIDEIATVALKAGRIICESSGETYRAEDTITIIGHSLGAERVEAYVTPTCIITQTEIKNDSGKSIKSTQAVRIKKRATNLEKITAVNALSRKIAAKQEVVDYDKLEAEIDNIANMRSYGFFFFLFIAALSGFAFTSLFAGSLPDACVSALIGVVMRLVLFAVAPLKLSPFITTIIGGSVVSFLSALVRSCGVPIHFAIVNIGTLMYLMPGVAIVIAIRDIIGGDYVSGTSRAMEAFVVALALSVGAAAGLLVFPDVLNYNTSLSVLQKPLPAFFYAAAASIAFACIFEVKNKFHIGLAALAGGFSWLFYVLLLRGGVSSLQACFLGSFSAGIIAEIFALLFKAPSTVFFIPALISFVPGGGMYTTMYTVVLGKSSEVSAALLSTLSIAGAIALAIAFATGVARVLASVKRKSPFNSVSKF